MVEKIIRTPSPINFEETPETLSFIAPKEQPNQKKGLPDVFDRDQFVEPQLTPPAENENSSSNTFSLQKKFAEMMPWASFLSQEPTKTQTSTHQTKPEDVLTKAIEPISSVPVLTPPDPKQHGPTFTETNRPSQKESKDPMVMMEELVTAILKYQLLQEIHSAENAKDGTMKFEEIRKLRQKTLDEAKDRLEHDRKVGQYLGYAQTGVAGIGFVLNIVCIFIPPAQFFAALATGLVTSLLTGTKGYFDQRARQEKGESELLEHDQKRNKERIETYQKDLGEAFENHLEVQETLAKMARMKSETARAVAQKA